MMNRFKNRSTSLFLPALLMMVVSTFLLTGCGDDEGPAGPDYSMVPAAYDTSGAQKQVLDSGVTLYIIKEGSGPFEVVARDRIEAHYTGRIQSSGDVFTSTYEGGDTEPASLSLPSTIDGFREGIIGMKAGGKRKIIVPPEQGYQSENHQLHGKTLVYDIKVVSIL